MNLKVRESVGSVGFSRDGDGGGGGGGRDGDGVHVLHNDFVGLRIPTYLPLYIGATAKLNTKTTT